MSGYGPSGNCEGNPCYTQEDRDNIAAGLTVLQAQIIVAQAQLQVLQTELMTLQQIQMDAQMNQCSC